MALREIVTFAMVQSEYLVRLAKGKGSQSNLVYRIMGFNLCL